MMVPARNVVSLVIAAIVGWMTVANALAQTAQPSSDQLELLKSLTPEQREALLEQMSRQGGGAAGSGSPSSTGQQPKDATSKSEKRTTRKLPDGKFSAAQVRDRTDIGRTRAILILECFDRLGITRRIGDVRVMHKDYVPVFGPAMDS